MDNLNILVEAKREYMEQLCILICPVMIDVFDEMFQEAQKLSKGRKVLIMFQNLLKDITNWSDSMAKDNTDNIANRCAWFKDLVAAVFVSSVKILSAVRLSKDSKKLSVKLPSNDIFIHTCYKNAAKELFKNPYVFTDNQSEHDRNDKLYERLALCVENTVKELIPVQQILQTYMTTHDDEILEPDDSNVEQDDVEEDEDDEIPSVESLARPEEEESYSGPVELPGETSQIPEVPGVPGVPGVPEVPVPPPVPFDNEFRSINTIKTPSSEPPLREPIDEGEDLFTDAAEMRQRKRF